MFMKERMEPDLLSCLPRLMHRLPKSHRSWEDVVQDHYKVKAGFGGEQQVDSILKRARFPYVAIADLQLAGRFCQIDLVLLTPAFALVLEVKNFSGLLSFDEKSYHMKQETRDGKILGYNSPVTQAWNAREELKVLFDWLGIELPVYTAIVLPYSSTLIEKAPSDIPVIYGYSLNHFISRLPQTGQLKSLSELEAIGQLLIDHHSLFPKTDYSKLYSYDIEQLKKGVLCVCGASCQKLSQRTFVCHSCGMKNSDGYERALEDWFEFASPEITNAQVREYLGLKDKYAAGYLMRKMGFCMSKGSRIYRRVK
ncbi:nuclease-related domain-containing protein [Planococcus sp. N028]|uniref:Nuclease-related domain-containing protein n=1 Tax=Planococcus shixiaomingii TaxID=3058393 RepID=A0ABT8N1F6_9BACL|nr:nuclease-related domain-containing protein [Planococcus sp. N028]MDN7241726.1 nuclease-related domain-containing protein [Planococcus sp. N028]